jgi:hypothetical protein
MIGIGLAINLEGVNVELYRKAEPNSCYIKFTADCFQGGKVSYINIGKTRDITCYPDMTKGWSCKYDEYITENLVKVTVCSERFPAPEPEPDPEPEDLTNYERIKQGTRGLLNDTTNIILASVGVVGAGIDTLTDVVENEFDKIVSAISSLEDIIRGMEFPSIEPLTIAVDDLTERIEGMEFPSLDPVTTAIDNLTERIEGMEFPSLDPITTAIDDLTEGVAGIEFPSIDSISDVVGGLLTPVTNRIDDVWNKLDTLEFPEMPDIRQIILDAATDLAVAMWDSILNEIERRYPK